MVKNSIAILHYAAPPVVGGVEAVIHEHCRVFHQAGYEVSVFAGRGDESVLAPYANFVLIPEMDSQNMHIRKLNYELERGVIPSDFQSEVLEIYYELAERLERHNHVIVHNIFTKHFNLPLTAALFKMLNQSIIRNCIAWCHDFTWTSPVSKTKVHPGYPWDLLRKFREDVRYVVVSEQRQIELARLYSCPAHQIRVVYNGVNPEELLGLSQEGYKLIERLNLFSDDLILIMPVRVTQAKNIELAMRVVASLKLHLAKPKLILTGPPDPHDNQSMEYFNSLTNLRSELCVEEEARFVFESGPIVHEPYFIESRVVGDLLRVADIMFMPSHREGFGMPILEAGMVGIPVICTSVPAATEIGGEDVIKFSPDAQPEDIVREIIDWANQSGTYQLRKRVRQQYTWASIFHNSIHPLLVR